MITLHHLLALSVASGASDLHVSPGSAPLLRIQGDLSPILDYTLISAETAKQLIYSVIDEEQQNQFESKQDLDFSICLPSVASFRVNIFRQNNGISAVFRVIPTCISSLDQLGLPDAVKHLLDLPNGLILVTGPTGSGKSTTLASMVNDINMNQAKHIITIEDPIEFIHQNKKSLVTQRQVYRDASNFASALRSSLREDPDVILIGEIRDLETMRLALTAAETGHLVLTTLHTGSAPRAVNRMIDVFPANEKDMIRNILAESLQAVICQKLVNNNQKERSAIFEIMLGTPAIRNLIREDKTAQMYSIMQTSNNVGMCTFDQYALAKTTRSVLPLQM